MTIKELITKLESFGDPEANVVVVDVEGGLIAVTGAEGLYADVAGELYVTIEFDEGNLV